jgi:hypothetical protein
MKKGKRSAVHARPPISARAAPSRSPAQQAAVLIKLKISGAITLRFCFSRLATKLKGQSSCLTCV